MLKTLFSLLALIPISAIAQEIDTENLPRWYQLELLIFQQNDVDTEELLRDQPFELEHNSILSDAPLLNPLLNKQASGATMPAVLAEKPLGSPPEHIPTTADPSEIPPSEIDLATFIMAEDHDLQLVDHKEKLRRRRAYRVLWHGAWQQALEEGKVNEYLITAGRLVLQPRPEEVATETPIIVKATPFDSLAASLMEQDEATFVAPEDIDTAELEAPSAEQRLDEARAIVASAPATFRELQGTIKIFKTRFVHLDIDLWFSQIDRSAPSITVPILSEHEPGSEPLAEIVAPASETTEIPTVSAQDFLEDAEAERLTLEQDRHAPEPPLYTMSYEAAYEPALFGHIIEDRRLRAEELHYVDHPLFGMLIKMLEVPHPLLRVAPEATGQEIDPLAF